MKKKYFPLQVDIILLDEEDVISTSGQDEIIPGDNHDNPFEGTYDDFGWT